MSYSGARSAIESPLLPMNGILQARGISRFFQIGDAVVTVLRDADLDLRAGEFIAIEGRSGSGKSTLLHILAGLDTSDSGSVRFEDRDYTRQTPPPPPKWLRVLTFQPTDGLPLWMSRVISPVLLVLGLLGLLFAEYYDAWRYAHRLTIVSATMLGLVVLLQSVRAIVGGSILVSKLVGDGPAARLRNLEFGFIFQFYHLLPEMNVLENTMLAKSIQYGWIKFLLQKSELRKKATELLNELGMGHRLKHRPSQLSGGERQRVAIARALMNSPKVLFADEPTGNLDAETGRQIMDLLEKLHRDHGQTIVMVTHDRTLAREADRVLVLQDGKLQPAV
jgi:lipoprotein-releasing system ATP-binding protein